MTALTQIAGTYSDGKTSKVVPAYLQVDDEDQVRIFVEEGNQQVFVAALKFVDVSPRLGNTARSFQLPDGAQFTSDENDAIDAFLGSRSSFSALIHFVESNTVSVLIALVLTVAVSGWFVTSGLPATAKVIAEWMPASLVASVGEGSLSLADKVWLDPSELPAEKVAEVRGYLEPYINEQIDRPVNLVFRTGVGANALALPDGTIVLTDELIELAETDEEIIAVFFHELGHLHHRHLIRRVVQDSILTIALVLLTGDMETAEALLGVPVLLLDSSYSRALETEADQYALESLHQHGLNVRAFGSIMEKLSQQHMPDDSKELDSYLDRTADSIGSYLSTHPETEERIKLIEAYAEKGDEVGN